MRVSGERSPQIGKKYASTAIRYRDQRHFLFACRPRVARAVRRHRCRRFRLRRRRSRVYAPRALHFSNSPCGRTRALSVSPDPPRIVRVKRFRRHDGNKVPGIRAGRDRPVAAPEGPAGRRPHLQHVDAPAHDQLQRGEDRSGALRGKWRRAAGRVQGEH